MLDAAVGHAFGLDGRDASAQAARRALNTLKSEHAALALIFASDYFPIESVMSGVTPVLGNTPLIGFSTAHELTFDGTHQRSVVVALLQGEGINAQANWWPDFFQRAHETSQALVQAFMPWDESPNRTVFLALDGLGGDFEPLCASLPGGAYALAGCLAGGDVHAGRTFQIGGSQAGSGGLAAAVINGKVRAGIGIGHGWQPVGAYFQVTRAEGLWVRSLNDKPASEAYAGMFGYQSRDWSLPPLNEMVRLYPLGVESENSQDLMIRSPLRVEADGSLRMSSPVPEGSTCHLMVGSVEACLAATQEAASRALADLDREGAQPRMAIVLLDIAWQAILEAYGGRLNQALKESLGEDVPIAGGYTFGQVARTGQDAAVLNQHIEVIVFGGV